MEKKGNKRLALLVGCNYPHTQLKLHGCVNDAVAMKNLLLKKFHFDDSNVELLIDVPVAGHPDIRLPTGANIMASLKKMVKKAEAGDILFFYFSGHGTIISSLEPGQPFRQHEAIVPCDLDFITDLELRQLIIRLPEGASFTILSDSCHSGGLIDKDKEQIGPFTVNKKITPPVHYKARGVSFDSICHWVQSAARLAHGAAQTIHTVSGVAVGITSALPGIHKKDVSLKFRPPSQRVFKSLTENEGILLSGCQENETSADVPASESSKGKAHGAFTNAVLELLEKSKDPLTNRELVMKARKVLNEHGFEQHPCLYCSDENAKATFLGIQLSNKIPMNTFLTYAVATNHEAGEDKSLLNDTVNDEDGKD